MTQPSPRGATREKLLEAALQQFAERGFDGVSIASIADALGLSKQALLHHFRSKEKLYGELLAVISADFEARVEALEPGDATVESVARLLVEVSRDSRVHRLQTALLVRELLDNRQRAARAGHWYLRNFLELLTARVHALPAWQAASRAEVITVVYQLLGAIHYFAISSPTLLAMFDAATFNAMEQNFAAQLRRMVIHTLRAGPADDGIDDGQE